jgi:hypothetical protein
VALQDKDFFYSFLGKGWLWLVKLSHYKIITTKVVLLGKNSAMAGLDAPSLY